MVDISSSSGLPPDHSQPDTGPSVTGDSSSAGEAEICLACRLVNRRKRMVMCGACGSWAHLSCVRLTRRQADNIPVWHCSPCSDSSHGNIVTDVSRRDVVPSDMANELAAHEKSVIILKRLPESARALVADSLATTMECALNSSTPQA